MSEKNATTERRDALAQALADAGIEKPIDEVEALVQGVAAAAVLDRHWLRLIHPDAETNGSAGRAARGAQAGARRGAGWDRRPADSGPPGGAPG